MASAALERCVGEAQRFLAEAWAKRPVLYPRADPEGFADLLTLDDVDAMVSSMSLRLPTFRLIKDGKTLPESSYTKSGRTGSKTMTGIADPVRIFELFDQGATIGLPVTTWRELLERAVGKVLEATELDEPLPAGYLRDPAALAAGVETRLAELQRLLDKADPVEVADAAVERFLTSRPSLLRGGLVDLTRLPSLGDHSAVRRRAGSVCELRIRRDRLTVLLGDRALR